MANLLYDGRIHQLTLRDMTGHVVGSWQAHNLTDRRATLPFIADGTYQFQDKGSAHFHPGEPDKDTEDGGFGPYGIFRIYYPGHQGVGVHSGRINHPNGGTIYFTQGCIRTTDAAMKAISDIVKTDPLTTLVVVANYREYQPDAIQWLHDHPVP